MQQHPAAERRRGAGGAEVHRDHDTAAVHEHGAGVLVDVDAGLRHPRIGELGPCLPQRDQRPVPLQHPRVRGCLAALGVRLRPVELRAPERLGVLRVGHDGGVPAVRGELGDAGPRPSRARARARGAVKNCHGVRGGPLLAHEQHRRERREQRQRRGDREPAVGDGCRRAGRRPRGCRPGRGSASTRRTATRASRSRSTGARARARGSSTRCRRGRTRARAPSRSAVERREVGVVAGGLAGERDVQRVVEVVAPLGGDAEPVRLARADHPRVVEVALGDQASAAGRGAPRARRPRRRAPRAGDGAVVDERVHGVEPQPVDVEVAQPHQRVVDDVAAHLVGAGPSRLTDGAPGVRARVVRYGPNSGR